MAYTKKIWKDYPDTTTPIIAADMNNIEDGLAGVLDWIYPVGTIYETTSTNLDTTTKMANHFGGTWEEYGSGRVLVAKSADTEFNELGKTGGSTEMQKHKHRNSSYVVGVNVPGYGNWEKNVYTGGSGDLVYLAAGDTSETGTGTSGNLQPYIVVYRYRRIT